MFHQGLCGIAWPFHVFWPLPLAKELLTIRPPVGISEVSRVPEKKVSGIRNISKIYPKYNEGTSDFYNTTDYLIWNDCSKALVPTLGHKKEPKILGTSQPITMLKSIK